MEISSNVREKQLRLDAPALLTPCGLAMRGSTMSIRVNLLRIARPSASGRSDCSGP